MRFLREEDMDVWEAPPDPVQDTNLRRLVDCLPDAQRHMVERTSFGGEWAAAAGREIGLTSSRAETQLRRGLATLKGWLEDPASQPKRDPHRPRERTDRGKPSKCGKETKWGRCRQPALEDGLPCAFHAEDIRSENLEYEREVVKGLREPIQARFTDTELKTMLFGRYRGDSRRIDQYVAGDPLEWDL